MKPEEVILKMADAELQMHLSPLPDNILTKFHIARSKQESGKIQDGRL